MIYLLAIVVTVVYGVLVLLMLWKWVKIPQSQANVVDDFFTTVLIPVRNESINLDRLIRSIQEGTTRSALYEIIVIDDHSTDNTVEVVKSLKNKYPNVQLAQLPTGSEGKKAGIAYGVDLAMGEWIVCTDGDSEVAEGWLVEYRQMYQSGAQLAFGPVVLFNDSRKVGIEILNQELAALVAMGGATLQMGKPTMINGCNYAFAKGVFGEVGGFDGNQKIATGDDEFLLRKIFKAYPDRIRFIKSRQALVVSEPPASLSAFYHQRRRWASKWKFHQDWSSWVAPVFMFFAYAVWCGFIATSMYERNWSFIGILFVKAGIDYAYISTASRIQNRTISIFNFVILQIIYPIYVVFFGVASNFGSYRWRERSHKI
ncbi:glycosyltransferase [Reichenbachiella carrageenanivorans]|uniref:Glycosyltransferase n=1 Tax=Reichenbachiella carrageenanivorans TaxID=2979869 RepID=A0ABY6CYA9_9BACT|nr:glycosyltransferase [Reichenbachiella carrageenanivorans]UXX78895.1 glycosyltransferase [Reichenbachiella carrageenanivorans]